MHLVVCTSMTQLDLFLNIGLELRSKSRHRLCQPLLKSTGLSKRTVLLMWPTGENEFDSPVLRGQLELI